MEHDSDLDLALACLRMAKANWRIEHQRFLALEQIYAGTERARAEALQWHMARALDESKDRVHDLLLQQRIALERRFGSRKEHGRATDGHL